MRRQLQAMIGLLIFALSLFAQTSFAQDSSVRTVVLEVSGGGTERLETALGELPEVEIRGQKWFLDEVKKSKVKASRLMTRPKDLHFVMSSAGAAYVVAVQPDGESWEVMFFDQSGEVAREFAVLRGGGELSREEATQIRDVFAELLGYPTDAPAQPAAAEPETVAVDDEPEADEPEVAQPRPRAPTDQPTVELGIAGALVKRSETYAGGNGAQFSFNSALYPGARVRAALFPSALSMDVGHLGFALDGLVAADSIASADESFAILHIEAELAVVLQTVGALALELGGRHARFQLPENDLLPSTSTTFVRFGLRFEETFGALGLLARASVIPFGLAGDGARLFGESSLAYGFAGDLAMSYALGEALTLRVGNRFRVLRTSFPGQGTLDFRDTRAFGLVWGPDVGITLAF